MKTKKAKRKATIAVRGKLAGKLAAGGRFWATAIATGLAGSRSRPRRLKLRISG